MERHDKGQDLVMVASEPLTFERGDWVTVPTNSIMSINKQTVLIHPVVDNYYQPDPSFSRSAAFAESKGMVGRAPEKGVVGRGKGMKGSENSSDASGLEVDRLSTPGPAPGGCPGQGGKLHVAPMVGVSS